MRSSNFKCMTVFAILAGTALLFALHAISSKEKALLAPSNIETVGTSKIDKQKPFSSIVSRCDSFDYGDVTPEPNVTSIFNCGSEEGRCKWFYPAKFLDEDCGIGREFHSNIEYMDSKRQKGELWQRGPPIVLPWVSLSPKVSYNMNGRTEPFMRHNLTFVHIHKTGGTSLVTAFSSLSARRYARGKRYTTYMPPTGRQQDSRISPMRKPFPQKQGMSRNETTKTTPTNPLEAANNRNKENWKNSGLHLDGIVKYRKEWGLTDSTLFAVVRDPAERFISAIGQATGATGSTSNGVAKMLVDECVKETSKETLSCFVDLVRFNSTWVELHFTPMVLELSFATEFKDIPVAIFPFIEVPQLMTEVGANPTSKKKDGSKIRKYPVLTDMSLDDYDDESMKTLCEIYRADVLFLWQIGYATNCDSVVDFAEKAIFDFTDDTLKNGHRQLSERM